MILVVGATGMVGGEVVRRLIARGERVRALVRSTSDPGKVDALRARGVEILEGDLRDAPSLDVACRDVDAVITTVSSMPFSYVPGANDIASVDIDGTIELIKAAKAAGVAHFVYTSFSAGIDIPCPLGDGKRRVERALAESGLRYTILRPSYFMDVWLSPVVGFDPANGAAAVFGAGDNPISWIAVADVAEFAVRSLDVPAAWDTTLELGGPEPLSPLQVVHIFEEKVGKAFEVQHVPVAALEEQLSAAEDPMAKSFVALQLAYAKGDAIEMGRTVAAMPGRLTSVAEYAADVAARLAAPVG